MPVSRADRPTEKSAQTRIRILDSAARVFSERGYAATRLEDIATAAGIKTGSLYYYFDSKDELVAEMLRVGVQETDKHVRSAVRALGKDAGGRERLQAAILAHAEAVIEAIDYTAANARIVGQLPEEVRREHYEDQRTYGDYWAKLLRDARATGEIRQDVDLLTLRFLLFGALNSTIEWPARVKRSPQELAAQVASIFFDGVAPG